MKVEDSMNVEFECELSALNIGDTFISKEANVACMLVDAAAVNATVAPGSFVVARLPDGQCREVAGNVIVQKVAYTAVSQ